MSRLQDLHVGKLYLVHKEDLYAWDGNRTITIQTGECVVILSTHRGAGDVLRLTLLTKNGTVATMYMHYHGSQTWLREVQS